jgi:putative ABC transport system ATP-binding protein
MSLTLIGTILENNLPAENPNTNTMIFTEDLTRIYRNSDTETYALNKVNIQIQEEEFVAVMGPSGCGKSTLLNILGLLDRASSGTYRFGDREVQAFSEKESTRFLRGNIGFIFQNFVLMDELNVRDNIALPLNYMKMKSAEKKERIDEVMIRLKIGHRAHHYPQQLSGGQQQRVAIARAVVAGPSLLLADEPTGNLDSKNGFEVMNLLSDLNARGMTIVMVTHSKRDAGFANRTIQMLDGKIQSGGNVLGYKKAI